MSAPSKDLELPNLPAELQSALEVLRNLELEAGNLLPPDQKENVAQLSSLQEKMQAKTALAWDISTGDKADLLFAKICVKLLGLGYSSADISNFINEQLTPGKGLNYCDTSEVEDASTKVGV